MTAQLVNVREEMSGVVPSRRYATHSVDRYPAKMIPQLARFGIERCTEPGQTVFDPFCGCGTVLVEARLSGRASVGVDINPYAVTLARAKAHVYDDGALSEAICQVLNAARLSRRVLRVPPWLGYWFHSLTLRQLLRIRFAIDSGADSRESDLNDALRAILAVTVRLASKADPRSPKPFISKRSRARQRGWSVDAFEVFEKQGGKFRAAASDFRARVNNQIVQGFRVQLADAARLPPPETAADLFDAVVSSPPYLSAQDYYRSSKLELAVLGLIEDADAHSLGPLLIGSGRGTVEPLDESGLRRGPREVRALYERDPRAAAVVAGYIRDIRSVVASCAAWTKPGGAMCLVVGDSTIRGLSMPVHQWFIDIGEEAGLDLCDHYLDAVRDRRLAPKRKGHESVIEHEHVLVFSR